MPLIPTEALPYFENAIYFPILITILERDLDRVNKNPFKFKQPYIKLVENALKLIREESKQTNIYLKQNNMKIIKGASDSTFTGYTFIHGGYEDSRRYLNVRLRNRTEELMSVYLEMVTNKKGDD